MSKYKKIIHSYKSKSKYGGIERHIEGLKNEINCLASDNFTTDADEKVLMFHGMSPDSVIRILMLRLRSRIVYWTPHFHPVKFTKRPIRYYCYLRIIGFILYVLRCELNVIFLTEREKKEFSKYFYLNRSLVVPLVPIEQIKYVDEIIRDLDFIYVARNDPIKDINLFVKAAKKFPNKSFILICNIFLNEIPKNLTIISDISDQELKNILRRTHFFISTSNYEAMGLAIIEAESNGTPAIIRNNTGYLEHVGPLSFNGVELTYNSEDELYNLIKLIDNYGVKALSNILRFNLPKRIEKISIKNFIHKYEKFIFRY